MPARVLLTTVLFASLLAGCSRDETPPASEPGAAKPPAPAAAPAADAAPPVREDWDAAALKVAEDLAAKIRAAGTPCDEYDTAPYQAFAADYSVRLEMPLEHLPLAEASCTAPEEEDLTFSVFADRAGAERYLEFHRRLLCRRAKAMNLADFPGIPFVLGDRWLIRPDERTTAVALADIVGGDAGLASCEEDKIVEEKVEPDPAPAE